MKAYKVCRQVTRKVFSSCVVYASPLKACYRLGYTTKAKRALVERGYGLCCFSTIEAAKAFVEGQDSETWVILEVEAEGFIKESRQGRVSSAFLYTVDVFLKEILQRIDSEFFFSLDWPEGTVFYEQVTPTKVVYPPCVPHTISRLSWGGV